VIEIADVFRRFADDYLSAHGATILPSHRRAIADILACRTEALGGYHPHVHCLVTGGGVSDDGRQWHPARNGFLVPFAALAKLVCGKLRAALSKRRPDLIFPEAA
jgi:Putative transposase